MLSMKMKPILFALASGMALAMFFGTPNSSTGQTAAAPAVTTAAPAAPTTATTTDDPAITAIVTAIAAQQATIADNQTKLDQKLAAVAEDLRVARIFVGRAGGKSNGN